MKRFCACASMGFVFAPLSESESINTICTIVFICTPTHTDNDSVWLYVNVFMWLPFIYSVSGRAGSGA